MTSPVAAAYINNGVTQLLRSDSRSINLTPTGDLTQPRVEINPPAVGLQLGFFIDVEAELEYDSAPTYLVAPFGGANLLKHVRYRDTNSYERTQTEGKFLELINTQRQGFAFGAAVGDVNQSTQYNDRWGVNSIEHLPAVKTVKINHTFFLPLAYSETDLRGAVFGSPNTFQSIILELLPKSMLWTDPTVFNPVDAVLMGDFVNLRYKSLNITTYNYTYTQRLPTDERGNVLVPEETNLIYSITNGVKTGLVANQDYAIDYPALWTYLSTTVIFVNGQELNHGRDIDSMTIKTANGTEYGRYTPRMHALTTQLRGKVGLPAGAYYHSHNRSPISTTTHGAISYVVKPKYVNANSHLKVGYEFIAPINLAQTVNI